MSNPITVKGYVCSVPRAADARQASVAVVQDDVEYRIIPRGAGADLADEVSALVEVTGLLEQVDERWGSASGYLRCCSYILAMLLRPYAISGWSGPTAFSAIRSARL